MHASVLNAFRPFTEPLEGVVHSMYVDIKGLITTGIGNLIDPIALAEQLPWTLEDGSKADLADVRADWHKLKGASDYYAKRHWRFARDATRVRLTDAAIDNLVTARLLANEAIIKKRFPAFDSFPADAQLAIFSIAWAVGAAFHIQFINLAAQIDHQEWLGAKASAKIREDNNPGVVPRNKANYLCFANAQIVKDRGLDPSVLYWPGSAKDDTPLPVTLPPSAAVDAVADLQATARRALELSDPVGLPGRNLRRFELGDEAEQDDPDSEPRS